MTIDIRLLIIFRYISENGNLDIGKNPFNSLWIASSSAEFCWNKHWNTQVSIFVQIYACLKLRVNSVAAISHIIY